MTTTPNQSVATEKRIILASSSPYRQQQLQQLGMHFTCISPDIDETALINEPPSQLAERLAIAKAKAVSTHENIRALFIGSDQTASCNGRLLGKPGNVTSAQEQLSHCQGNVVMFYTALALYDSDSKTTLADTTTTEVKFRSLTRQQINTYIEKEQPLDCAGSFKCEGLGISLFDYIRSDDPSALIGLPLIRLTSFLNQFGASPL
ncbi:Maf family protein [Teredinibacter purpureus]|uniref:Maf family protein n=1 Tax=Teredinibacter purpureus TaxID=2731756 RepID=UPI0005F7DB5E|nr:Maf family protein [Teredinibacter purpureus]